MNNLKITDLNIDTINKKQRLETIRKSIKAENASYYEIAELQSLSKYIDKDDVELLEWAGVPEFKIKDNL